MKTRVYIVIMMAVAAMAASCEKRIDIDIDDQQQKVVVKSVSNVGDDVAVAVTLSRPIYGTFYVREGEDYFPKVDNATATLTVNGGAEIVATRSGNIYTFAHKAQAGEELTLRVEVPGHEAVIATATVPSVPVVNNVVFDTAGARGIYGLPVRFTLADNGSAADYYSVRLHEYDTVYTVYIDTTGAVMERDTFIVDHYAYFECIDYLLISNTDIDNMMDTEDPSATSTYFGQELLFTDASINGLAHDIVLTIEGSYGDYYDYYYKGIDYGALDHVDSDKHMAVVLEVADLTRDLYLYKQTVDAYDDDALLNFFSEPVQIHSNMNGGIGIFGFSATRTFKYHFVNAESSNYRQY